MVNGINVNVVIREECCGCGLCSIVCPSKAIVIKYNENGFPYPYIDEGTKCTMCGLCVKKCPVVNVHYNNDISPDAYILASSDEIRKNSSSGGVFKIFADYFIDNGWYVAGAVFDENFNVLTIVSKDFKDVERMMGSKYVQSNVDQVYVSIKELINSGEHVLFTGTPCQVAALNNFVGENENLLTLEMICHGVPSQQIFDEFLNESPEKKKITKIDFRNKSVYGWNTKGIVCETTDGTWVCPPESALNQYYKLFSLGVSLRDCCFNCKFAEPPRCADLTMGDYWNAKHNQFDFDDGLGLSLLLINNSKGRMYFDNVKSEFKVQILTTYSQAIKWNRDKKIQKQYVARKRFFEERLNGHSVIEASDRMFNWKYDVGLFGVTNNANYGGLITYYALYEVIRSLGYSCLFINNPKFSYKSSANTHARLFFANHTEMSAQREPEKMFEVNSHVDTIVLGSDQVWNYDLFKSWKGLLYLDFVDQSKKMISFAASFGHDYHTVPENNVPEIQYYLNRFDYISVREKSGVDILKKDFNQKGEWVLDPVFLIEQNIYCDLADKSEVNCGMNYVASYIIGPNSFKMNVLKDVIARYKCPSINLTDGDPQSALNKYQYFTDNGMPIQKDATIEDWLKIIINCDILVTDSFHAICFCIMFKKKFILLQAGWALSRIDTITNLFGVQNRWVRVADYSQYHFDESWTKSLDYEFINSTWNREKQRCIKWLSEALKSSKNIRYIDVNGKIENMGELSRRIKLIILNGLNTTIVFRDIKSEDLSNILQFYENAESLIGNNLIVRYINKETTCKVGKQIAFNTKDMQLILTNDNICYSVVENNIKHSFMFEPNHNIIICYHSEKGLIESVEYFD